MFEIQFSRNLLLCVVSASDLPLLPWLVKPLSMLFYGERHLYLEDEALPEQSPAAAAAPARPDEPLPAPILPEESPERNASDAAVPME